MRQAGGDLRARDTRNDQFVGAAQGTPRPGSGLNPVGADRGGIVGAGGPYTVKSYTGVQVDRGRPHSSTSPVSELTVEAPSGITEERDWWATPVIGLGAQENP